MVPFSIVLSFGFSYYQSLLKADSNESIPINDLETSKNYEQITSEK